MPPRHGKSELVSRHGATWYLAQHPDRFVMLASYSDALSRRWGRAARDDYETYSPALGSARLRPDVAARADWQTDQGGGMFTGGVGGSFTGRGASIGIIDDPIKSYAEGQSQTVKDAVWDFYRSTFYTRLTPTNNAIIIIMARWAEDDLAGRAIAQWREQGTPYEILDLPALALEDDALGRESGEALWPEAGWTRERLLEVRAEMGPRQFDALYQGRPSKGVGAVFQRAWFRYAILDGDRVTLLDAHGRPARTVSLGALRVFQMVDLASTVGGGDYFAVGTFGLHPTTRDLVVLDMYRAQIGGPEQLGVLRQLATRWRVQRIGIEAVGYQAAFVQAAVADGLPAVPIKRARGESKEQRAYAVAARYEARAVYHLRGAPWVGDLEAELESFPNGKHDDQVDTVSDAGAVVSQIGGAGGATGVRVA